MKNIKLIKLTKKKILVFSILALLFIGTFKVVSLNAQSKIPNSNGINVQQRLKEQQKEQSSFLDKIKNIFSGEKTITKLDNKTLQAIQNKTGQLSDTGTLVKRNIISNPKVVLNGDRVLEQNKDFFITYSPTPDSFLVAIIERPATDIKKETEKWFLDKGFTTSDLCSLGIHFVTRLSNPTSQESNFYKLAVSGCP